MYQLITARGTLTEEVGRFYAAQLVAAFAYLHSYGVVYRDLKPENVLLDSAGHPLLADMGFAQQVSPHGRTHSRCGSEEYAPPELLDGRAYGAQVDWWAFGALLYEILCGRTPFFDRNRKAMFRAILTDAPRFGDERTTAPFSPAATTTSAPRSMPLPVPPPITG